MAIPVKICGLTREQDIDAAIEGGAAFLGFNFYPPSPRCLTPGRWRELRDHVARRCPTVGIFVDADDDWLAEVTAAAPLDWLQLHGKETPERVAAIAASDHAGARLIKAIAVAEEGDLDAIATYVDSVDMFLFDAKPPKVPGAIPGGNGLSFDWRLLAGRTIARPWLLAGGLSAANIGQAVEHTGASMVDAASGIEDAPGIKNKERLDALLAAARNLGNA